MKMAFFEVQIIVKSCSAYKDASLYQIRCLYLFFYNFFRSTGTELRRRLYCRSCFRHNGPRTGFAILRSFWPEEIIWVSCHHLFIVCCSLKTPAPPWCELCAPTDRKAPTVWGILGPVYCISIKVPRIVTKVTPSSLQNGMYT